MTKQDRSLAFEIVAAFRRRRALAFANWRRNPTTKNSDAYDHAAQAHALALVTYLAGGDPARKHLKTKTTEERTAQ